MTHRSPSLKNISNRLANDVNSMHGSKYLVDAKSAALSGLDLIKGFTDKLHVERVMTSSDPGDVKMFCRVGMQYHCEIRAIEPEIVGSKEEAILKDFKLTSGWERLFRPYRVEDKTVLLVCPQKTTEAGPCIKQINLEDFVEKATSTVAALTFENKNLKKQAQFLKAGMLGAGLLAVGSIAGFALIGGGLDAMRLAMPHMTVMLCLIALIVTPGILLEGFKFSRDLLSRINQ